MPALGWPRPRPDAAAAREAARAAAEARRLTGATTARLDRLAAAHEDLIRRRGRPAEPEPRDRDGRED
jgi:hypothetical protein